MACDLSCPDADTPDAVAGCRSQGSACARARQLHRGPVRGSAARRPRCRRREGRGAGGGRPDAPVGRVPRRAQPLVAVDRAQQAIGRDRPARRTRSRRRRAARAAVRHRARELPSRAARGVGPRLRRRSRPANPGVVLVHVSGFGQTGPRAHEPGFGSIGEAMGGLRHTTGDRRSSSRARRGQPRRRAGRAVRRDRHARRDHRAGAVGSRAGGRRRDLRVGAGAHGVDGRRLGARRV